MSQLTFEYDLKDNASAGIDRINNKMQALKGNYREMKKSIGDLKQALNVMNGMGIGIASGAIQAAGLGKEGSKETGPYKTTMAPFVEGVNSAANMGSLLVGGAFAGTLLDAFSRDKGGIGGSASRIAGRIASTASLTAQSSFASFAQNMMHWEGGGTKSWGQLMRKGARPSVSGMGGGFAGGAASIGSLSKVGGFAARLGAGLATGGIALAAQLGYEYAVEPSITQFFGQKEYTSDYIKNLSDYYLQNRRRQEQDVFNQSTEGFGSQMYFFRDLFGMNQSERDTLSGQLRMERSDRLAEVTKALWLQNRE